MTAASWVDNTAWPAPDYVNPTTRGSGFIVLNSILIGAIVFVVALRYYTRLAINRWFGSDDVLIGIALLVSIAHNATVTLAYTQYGWDRHVYDIPVENIPSALKLGMLAKIWFGLAATLTRASLLCFYGRLLGRSGTWRSKCVLWTAHFFNATIGVVCICSAIFLCRPIDAYWSLVFASTYQCLDEGMTMLVGGILMSCGDLLVTLIPIPVVTQLQMPTKQQIGIVTLLSLGFIVTGLGALRTYYIWECFMNSKDLSWASNPLNICATVEIDLGVICACIPAIRSFVKHFSSSPQRLSTRLSTSLFSPNLSVLREQPPQNTRCDHFGAELETAISPRLDFKHVSATFSEMQDMSYLTTPAMSGRCSQDPILTARPFNKEMDGDSPTDSLRVLIAQRWEMSHAELKETDMV